MHVVVWEVSVYSKLARREALFVHECRIYEITVPFSIAHPNTGTYYFASQECPKGEPVRYNCCTSVYKDMGTLPDEKVSGDNMTAALCCEFFRTSIHICKTLCGSDGKFSTVCVVSAKINFFRFISNSRRVAGKVLEKGDALPSWRTSNVIFDQKTTAKTYFWRHNAPVVRANRNISPGEKLLLPTRLLSYLEKVLQFYNHIRLSRRA